MHQETPQAYCREHQSGWCPHQSAIPIDVQQVGNKVTVGMRIGVDLGMGLAVAVGVAAGNS